MTDSNQYLSSLHKQIDGLFSMEEMRTLAFDLGVDYENVPGNVRSAFVRNLILQMARDNRLHELVRAVQVARPRANVPSVPSDFQLPSSVAQEDIRQVINYTVYGDFVHGDKVAGDKVQGDKVGGDKFDIGDIKDVTGVAIGRGAQADVKSQQVVDGSPAPVTIPALQELAGRIQGYLNMVPANKREAADELAASLTIVQQVLSAETNPQLHLRLIGRGQRQLARELGADVPGLEEMVERWISAVGE